MSTREVYWPTPGSGAEASLVQRVPIGEDVTPQPDPTLAPGKVDKEPIRFVYRDIPIVAIQNSWTVDDARGALAAHMNGQFSGSTQLWESILGDPRVSAVLGSRMSAMFGRPYRVEPADDSPLAKEIAEAWSLVMRAVWASSDLRMVHASGIGLGVGMAEVVWDTDGFPWTPRLRYWSTRFAYYNFAYRDYWVSTQDGVVTVEPGSGKWLIHAPYGLYRGWIMGAVRGIAEPWLLRHFSFRDAARFAEVHGSPWIVGEVPMAADPGQRAQFQADLSRLGANTSIMLGKGVTPEQSYGVSLIEAKDTAHPVFLALRDMCDMDITLAINRQNLTTQVTEGSQAAASVHGDVRNDVVIDDSTAWLETLHRDMAVPFATLNWGRPDLAPRTYLDASDKEDQARRAQSLANLGSAFNLLKLGNVQFLDPEEVRRWAQDQFGVSLPSLKFASPEEVDAELAAKETDDGEAKSSEG